MTVDFIFDPSFSDIMVYSSEELKALIIPQLKQILGAMQHPVTGNKDVLIARVLAHQAEIPADHWKLQPAKADATAPPTIAPQDEEVLEDLNWFDNYSTEARLSQPTIDLIKDQQFKTRDDLQLLSLQDLKDLGVPLRDALTIRRTLEGNGGASVLTVKPQKDSTRKILLEDQQFKLPPTSTRHRSRSNSTVGESDNTVSEFAIDSELPERARELPRPHQFVCPKPNARGSFKKPEALAISIEEFFAESARITQRLSSSADRQDTLAEYAEYIEFLSYKKIDYDAAAVLQFDDAFRRRAQFEKKHLGESALRRSLADKYFHAGTRLGRTASNRLFRPQRSYENGMGQQNDQREPCGNFNKRSFCSYGAKCIYAHRCEYCNMYGHGALRCFKRQAAQQSGQTQQGQPGQRS